MPETDPCESGPVAQVTAREEEPDDIPLIREVAEAAFRGALEAAVIDSLRTAGAVVLSMVADAGGQVVGHVLITPVTVATPQGEVQLLGLGPLSVLPDQQGQGVATLLVEAALERVRTFGHAGVVVLGSDSFYPRFGFIPAHRWGLRWEGSAHEEAFMALELSPGRLAGISGVVRYRPEFDLFPAS
jgi:putative acetyltransferase